MWRFVPHNNVSGFDKLKSRLPNNDVDHVYKVAEDVEEDPVSVGGFAVVGESQPGGAEPHVVVVRQRHDAQPGNVSTIWGEHDRNHSRVFTGELKKAAYSRCDAYL